MASGIRHVVLAPLPVRRAARRIRHRAASPARWCPGFAPPASSSSPEERGEPPCRDTRAAVRVLLAVRRCCSFSCRDGRARPGSPQAHAGGLPRPLHGARPSSRFEKGFFAQEGRLHVHGARQRRARRGRRDLGQRPDLRSRSPGRGEAPAGRQAHPARLQPRRAGDAGPRSCGRRSRSGSASTADTPLAARYAALKGLTIGITRARRPHRRLRPLLPGARGPQPRPRRDARPGRRRAGAGRGVQERAHRRVPPLAAARRRRSSARGRAAS